MEDPVKSSLVGGVDQKRDVLMDFHHFLVQFSLARILIRMVSGLLGLLMWAF